MLGLAKITRLLPREECIHADAAEENTREFAERWNIKPHHFDSYNSMSRFLYSKAISIERLQAACTVHSIFFFIDDLFFDTDQFNPSDFGIAPEIGTDLKLVSGFLADLMRAFKTHKLSSRPTPIEEAFCEAGNLVASQCDPEWFALFAEGIEEYITAVMSREVDLQGQKAVLTDLQSFFDIRERDTGGLHTCQLIELTKDTFLTPEARAHEAVERLTWLAIRMASYVNDIFSYHKDVIIEGSDFNLVKIYMDLEGLSFEGAVTASVDLVNAYAHEFEELRASLPNWSAAAGWGDGVEDIVSQYVDGLAEMMSGNVYWHGSTNRYRSPESPFDELREIRERRQAEEEPSMTYKLYAHDELPAIICVLGPDFSLREDMENVLKELEGLLDKAPAPVYYVNDITGAKLTFGDIVLGMGMAASAGGVMRHHNLHELITVSASDIVKLGVKALGQAQYGGIKARISNSVDEALAFIQTESKKV